MYRKTLLASAILSALAMPSYAQEVQDEQDYIEEITVTAQMREQSVMDVPVTMDVISSEFLERTNIMELDELSRVLPNVQIQEQAVSLPSFNIRGVTDDTSSVSSTPRISVYQDGFDISKKTVSSVSLYDIARVEVLKGPQPTLFGVAAANGAISIHSQLPTNEKEMKVQLGYDTQSGKEAEFMFNSPINDNHSFRIAGLYREMDGVVENNACSDDSYYGNANMTDHLGNSVACNSEDLQGVSVQALRGTWKATYEQLEVIARASME